MVKSSSTYPGLSLFLARGLNDRPVKAALEAAASPLPARPCSADLAGAPKAAFSAASQDAPKAAPSAAGADTPKTGLLVKEPATAWVAPAPAKVTCDSAIQKSVSGLLRSSTVRSNSTTSSSSLTDLKKSKKPSGSSSPASIAPQFGVEIVHSSSSSRKLSQVPKIDVSKAGRRDDASSNRSESIYSDTSKAAGKKTLSRSNSGSRLCTPTPAGPRRVGTTCLRKHNPKGRSMYSDARNAFGCLQDYNITAALKRIALMDNVEINAKDWLGRTLLHYAAAKGCMEVVQELLANEKFQSLNSMDSMGRSALMAAAETGQSEVCKALLDSPAFEQAEAKDIKGWTALHFASSVGHVEVIDCLLDHPEYKAAGTNQERGWTPLHCAFMRGHAGTVQKLQARTKMKVTKDTHSDVVCGVRASQAKLQAEAKRLGLASHC